MVSLSFLKSPLNSPEKQGYSPLRKGRITPTAVRVGRLRQFFVVATILTLVLLTFTEYSPVHALIKFFRALVDVIIDFDFTISRNASDCFIVLWTREHRNKAVRLIDPKNITELEEAGFNRTKPVKFLVHGFSDAAETLWTRKFRSKYLDLGDFNIFSVDWGKLARSPWYTTAVKNADHVGKYSADFIKFLTSEEIGVSFDDIHILGASLGAQAAGHIGYHLKGKVARITGLDPSGPLFHTVDASKRLDASDARFVDVVHSAGKWVGDEDVIGHVDFFPNMGRAPQPGCEDHESLDLTCSHFMSWDLYGDTIAPKTKAGFPMFHAVKCKNSHEYSSGKCCQYPDLETALMGEYVNTSARGQFYLVTNPRRPYAKATAEESTGCQWIVPSL